jgi:hypothetical protein
MKFHSRPLERSSTWATGAPARPCARLFEMYRLVYARLFDI